VGQCLIIYFRNQVGILLKQSRIYLAQGSIMSNVHTFEIFLDLTRLTILIRMLYRSGKKASEILRRVFSSSEARRLALAATLC